MRNRYFLLLDLPLIAIAAFGAFAMRFDLQFFQQRPEFVLYLAAAVVLKPLAFLPFGMYARYWRYGTAMDLVAVALAVTTSAVAMAVFVAAGLIFGYLHEFARPVVMIDWLLTLALVGGLRMSVRIIGDVRHVSGKPAPTHAKRVLIVGAGEAGNLVARELYRNPQLGMIPAGFLDDSPAKWNKQILGIPVLGPLASLEAVMARDSINEVIIAMPAAAGAAIRAAAEACRQSGIIARVVPGVYELLDGNISVSRLRKVEIVDLLRRPQIIGRAEQVSYLAGQTVMITGAGGSIGAELSRQVAYSGPRQLILLGHGENSIFSVHAALRELYPHLSLRPVIADIRDSARLDAIFKRFRPDVVFHAAAHKHVPLMETNPEEAFTNNVRGTQNMLRAAEQWGTGRFVLISTDKAVAPSSIMGASKRLAESLVISAGARTKKPYVVVRFGNVLGSRGSVVPTLQAQIESGGPVTITHPDMKRFFMTIPEAVQLVLQAGATGDGGNLYVLNMGEPIRILDLAKDLIRLSGADPATMPIEFTGIRPGEKLEETLWEDGATVDKTGNPDVFRVTELASLQKLDLRHLIDDVIAAAESGDVDRLRLSLELALPTYVPPSVEDGSAHSPVARDDWHRPANRPPDQG